MANVKGGFRTIHAHAAQQDLPIPSFPMVIWYQSVMIYTYQPTKMPGFAQNHYASPEKTKNLLGGVLCCWEVPVEATPQRGLKLAPGRKVGWWM